MKVTLVIALAGLILLSACIKAPNYPIEPKIEFVSVATSTSVIYVNGSNIIYVPDTITLNFTDGDGDIYVYDNPADSNLCVNLCAYKTGDTSCFAISSKNIFVIDSRDSCMSTYATGRVESTNKFNDVSGEIKILHTIFAKDPSCPQPHVGCPPEAVKFKIRIKDNAGHFSNEVETTPITLEVRTL